MIEKALRIGLANVLLVAVEVLVGPFVESEQEPEIESDEVVAATRARFRRVQ